MTRYQKVIDKIQENNLSWGEIDTIFLNMETYEEFVDRASFDTDTVKQTNGTEKIRCIADNGMEITIEI